jgi:hypothetical protein
MGYRPIDGCVRFCIHPRSSVRRSPDRRLNSSTRAPPSHGVPVDVGDQPESEQYTDEPGDEQERLTGRIMRLSSHHLIMISKTAMTTSGVSPTSGAAAPPWESKNAKTRAAVSHRDLHRGARDSAISNGADYASGGLGYKRAQLG